MSYVTNDYACTYEYLRVYPGTKVPLYAGTTFPIAPAVVQRRIGMRCFMFLFLLFLLIVVQGLREYRLEMALKTERMRHQKPDDSPRVPA